jgi:hypothetical protein
MNPELPFDSIESAHEFVGLFVKAVLESKRDIDADIQREMGTNVPRRLDALQIVAHKLEALELYLTKCRRVLNDLRSEERTGGAQALRPKSSGIAKPDTPPSPSPEMNHSRVGPETAVAPHASICAAVRKRGVSSSRDPHLNVVAADAWYIRPEFKSESKASQTSVLCDTKRG